MQQESLIVHCGAPVTSHEYGVALIYVSLILIYMCILFKLSDYFGMGWIISIGSGMALLVFGIYLL